MHICLVQIAVLTAAAPSFAKEDEGKVVTVTRDSITIGKKHPNSYKITRATAIRVNGISATVSALRQGMRANIVSHEDIAASIAAQDAPSLDGASLEMKPRKNK